MSGLNGRRSISRRSGRRGLVKWRRCLVRRRFRRSFFTEERSKENVQANQYQNARPPASAGKEDGQPDQPEQTAKPSASARAEKRWSVAKSFMSMHVYILLKIRGIYLNIIRLVPAAGCVSFPAVVVYFLTMDLIAFTTHILHHKTKQSRKKNFGDRAFTAGKVEELIFQYSARHCHGHIANKKIHQDQHEP
jgi:hypothetical protein